MEKKFLSIFPPEIVLPIKETLAGFYRRLCWSVSVVLSV